MEETRTDETCDKCKKDIRILISDFEQIMKDGDLILCPDCETTMLDEQAETERPPKRCWQYKVCHSNDMNLDVFGAEGWELVAVDNGQTYFKREYYEET